MLFNIVCLLASVCFGSVVLFMRFLYYYFNVTLHHSIIASFFFFWFFNSANKSTFPPDDPTKEEFKKYLLLNVCVLSFVAILNILWWFIYHKKSKIMCPCLISLIGTRKRSRTNDDNGALRFSLTYLSKILVYTEGRRSNFVTSRIGITFDRLSSVIRLSVNFSNFNLLLQTHSANFNQTSHKSSLGGGDSIF